MPGLQNSELISMYDSHTWPETRRSETFHSQASKLWEFVTDEMVNFYLISLTASVSQFIPSGSIDTAGFH